MPTIVDYASLQAAVTEYLARDQDTTLIARIPTFIQLAEAKFSRLLFTRQMETLDTLSTDPNSASPELLTLPNDFQSMRRIRLSSVDGKPPLMFKSLEGLEEYRFNRSDVPGQPVYFTLYSNLIELCPTPDDVYTIEMIYRQLIPALSDINPTNWLLTNFSDGYLYGTLLESAPYIKEDERIQTWALGLKTVIDDLNSKEFSVTFNAGPLVMRTSGVTP